MIPRIRMIAGPNGSGKTTLANFLRDEVGVPLGHELNPDHLEAEMRQFRRLIFADHDASFTTEKLVQAVRQHPLSDRIDAAQLRVENNVLQLGDAAVGGYLAAVLSDVLRRDWIARGVSFTFETVMSSADKVDLFRSTQSIGYRTYLYYVCTEDPDINRERVASRVRQRGHDVPADKILERYRRSLNLLPAAVAAANRAYLFDNSETGHRLVGEYENGQLVAVGESPLPPWFAASMLQRPAP